MEEYEEGDWVRFEDVPKSPPPFKQVVLHNKSGYRISLPVSAIHVIHEEQDGCLLKVDCGSGNFESSIKVREKFDEVLERING